MRLGAITLGLLVLLSGCIKGGDDTAQTAAVNTTDIVAPPEGRGAVVAFEETNMTESGSGGVNHHHDLWNGRGRVVIFETHAMMDPSDPVAQFQPPQGTFVYEGTGTIEFTISNPTRHACEPVITFGSHFYCTDYLGGGPAGPPVPDPNPPTGLKLRYKHASTSEWIDAGELAWGAPTVIKITQAIETDMPHATSSVWRFQVESPNQQDSTLQFDAKAEIVRAEGEDIPLWPPHPLFYDADRTTRVVVDNVAAESCDSGLTATGCTGAGEAAGPVKPTKLISYGTRTLYVWANVSAIKNTNPATAPTAWFLYHKNATGVTNITNPFDFANYGIEKKELAWVLPVDDGSMDSPYADGSRWEFELGASYTSPDNPVRRQSCYGGCADWDATYTLTVHASSLELAPDQYHLYCLDPDVYCGEA
ncbi:MAG TPA: hypothetical protein VM370_00980 [Candidatus Thermoplasmatota archaeon]|nr:hypothetical protein [Candidatus Thermoplasmatota archaeon]